MASLEELEGAVESYRVGKVSLAEFQDWYEDASRCMFGESHDVLAACLAINALFSELQSGSIHEREFRKELATAVRPFAPRSSDVELVCYDVVQANVTPLRAPVFAAGAFALVMVATWGIVQQQSRQLQMNESWNSELTPWTVSGPNSLPEPQETYCVES